MHCCTQPYVLSNFHTPASVAGSWRRAARGLWAAFPAGLSALGAAAEQTDNIMSGGNEWMLQYARKFMLLLISSNECKSAVEVDCQRCKQVVTAYLSPALCLAGFEWPCISQVLMMLVAEVGSSVQDFSSHSFTVADTRDSIPGLLQATQHACQSTGSQRLSR